MAHSLPISANRAIFSLLLALHGLILFGLPALLVQSAWWGLVLLPVAWLTIVHWGMIHESIHKLLFTQVATNDYGGRALGILLGISFHVVRFGHLMHHKLNRHFHSERIENPTLGQRAYYYAYLLFGLYLSEIYTGLLLAILPRRRFMKLARASFLKPYEEVAVAGERFFYERGNIAHVRVDVALAVLLYGAAFYLYGSYWPWLLGFIALRAVVISFMDNIYHYATPADNSKPGKELALPGWVSALLLHGNYHETHHSNPQIPWAQLPQVHARQQRGFDGGFVAHGLMQFRGPAYP